MSSLQRTSSLARHERPQTPDGTRRTARISRPQTPDNTTAGIRTSAQRRRSQTPEHNATATRSNSRSANIPVARTRSATVNVGAATTKANTSPRRATTTTTTPTASESTSNLKVAHESETSHPTSPRVRTVALTINQISTTSSPPHKPKSPGKNDQVVARVKTPEYTSQSPVSSSSPTATQSTGPKVLLVGSNNNSPTKKTTAAATVPNTKAAVAEQQTTTNKCAVTPERNGTTTPDPSPKPLLASADGVYLKQTSSPTSSRSSSSSPIHTHSPGSPIPTQDTSMELAIPDLLNMTSRPRRISRSASVGNMQQTSTFSLPSSIDHLLFIPVEKWSYADVADFFRGILSLPLDLSRETSEFIVANKLDGQKLANMTETDLRLAGVNTQWCHRLVTALAAVQKRQREQQAEREHEQITQLKNYVEKQFSAQTELLKKTVDGQTQLEGMLKEQLSGHQKMQQRIAEIERALQLQQQRMEESIVETRSQLQEMLQGDVVLMEDMTMEEGSEQVLVEGSSTKRHVKPYTSRRTTSTSTDLSTHLTWLAQGFTLGAVVAAVVMRFLK